MIEIKDKALLGALESRDADNKFLAETASEVKVFWRGGRAFEPYKDVYLQPKVDETAEMFAIRKKRFVYTNVFASLLNQFLGRFSAGRVSVQAPENVVFTSFRNQLPENTFLSSILRDLLLNQNLYIQVDKKQIDFQIGNLEQQRQMEASGDLTPYIIKYTPEELLSEAADLSWFKFRVLYKENQPFGEPKTTAIWRYIDGSHIIEYSATVELDKSGKIIKVDGVPATNRTEIPLTKITQHNLDKVPVLKLSLPDEQYIGGQVLLKLRQYLLIENNLTDAALTAGYIQRVFTPFTEKIDDYGVSENSELEDLKSSNAYIIKAERFKFEEISGSSIKTLAETLDRVEAQIAALICATTSDATASKTVLGRSAASKLVDESHIEAFVRSYGRILINYYQQILRLAGDFIGLDSNQIQVLGLDSFEVNALGQKLDEAALIIESGIESKIDLVDYWQDLENSIKNKMNKDGE